MLYFIHIPKTAGTSLRRLLEEHVFPGRLHPLYHDIGYWNAAETKNKLTGNEVIYGHFCYGVHRLLGDRVPSYLTFLRDPVERVISLYRHFRDRPGTEAHALIRDRRLTLCEFVESGCCYETNNHMVKIIGANYGRTYRWLYHANNWWSEQRGGPRFHQLHGRVHLRRALRNLERDFRFVGVMENFEAGVQGLLTVCQQPPATFAVPRENVANGTPLDPLDAPTRAVIETANDLDLELYHAVKRDPARYHASLI